jgi:hypothetical protein
MVTCVQEKVYNYFVTGALDLVPNLEEQMDDGMTSCLRWHRRTLKTVGKDGKHTAQNRVQMAVALAGKVNRPRRSLSPEIGKRKHFLYRQHHNMAYPQ